MFFQLLYIHLFRPFLQYTKDTSPLPDTVSPRKLCTAAASMISKLMRLYKRSHGLRQICNICVYIVHSACTIHLLNLPDKGAKRDIVHGVKHLEEIAEGWLCARRSLGMVSVLARKWKVELPDDAVAVLARTDRKFGPYTGDAPSPGTFRQQADAMNPSSLAVQQPWDPAANLLPNGQGLAHTAPVANGTSAPAVPGQSFPSHPAFPIPPFHPNGLQAQQHPSAQHFPPVSTATTTPPPPRAPPVAAFPTPATSSAAAAAAAPAHVASPSDMFGGIEQLLHESGDWAYRDQAQLATGFENWTGVDVSPAIWRDGLGAAGMNGGTGGSVRVNGTGAAGGGGVSGNGGAGFAGLESWNAVGGGYLNGYNEDEWYQ